LAVEGLLGDNGGETAEKMTFAINDNNLKVKKVRS
jgi:hypothetical protein